MQGGDWYDADAVVISDFIAQRLPDDVVNKVKELQRVHQHRFHAVAMSAHGKPGIMRIFDHIWRFDTGLRSRCSDAGSVNYRSELTLSRTCCGQTPHCT